MGRIGEREYHSVNSEFALVTPSFRNVQKVNLTKGIFIDRYRATTVRPGSPGSIRRLR